MSIPDSYLVVIKNILREKDIPFFSDEEIDFYYNKNNKNLNNTIYECLLVKAENTTLNISGLSVADSSAYSVTLDENLSTGDIVEVTARKLGEVSSTAKVTVA